MEKILVVNFSNPLFGHVIIFCNDLDFVKDLDCCSNFHNPTMRQLQNSPSTPLLEEFHHRRSIAHTVDIPSAFLRILGFRHQKPRRLFGRSIGSGSIVRLSITKRCKINERTLARGSEICGTLCLSRLIPYKLTWTCTKLRLAYNNRKSWYYPLRTESTHS